MIDLPSPLVSTAWLAANLGRPGLKVFDATYYLPAEGRDAETEFAAAHIQGALRFDIDSIADPDTDLPHMVPSPFRFEKLVGALGIGNDDAVVFYDQKGVFSAPRGWWLMNLFGHTRAAVLDGGLPHWRAEGLPCESGTPGPATPARFTARFRPALLRGIGDLRANLDDPCEQILDARAADRFHARVPEPRPGLRGGHIPGASNLPFNELLDGTRLLPPEQLRARFAAAGIDGSCKVVTSCGSGVSAAVLTIAMVAAGLPMGALYDGSWTEWGFATDLPAAS